jgi:hypothetical protein
VRDGDPTETSSGSSSNVGRSGALRFHGGSLDMKKPILLALVMLGCGHKIASAQDVLVPRIEPVPRIELVPWVDRLSPSVRSLITADANQKISFKAYDGSTISGTIVPTSSGHLASASGTARHGGLSKLFFPNWPSHSPLVLANAKFKTTIISISSDLMTYTFERPQDVVIVKIALVSPGNLSGPFSVSMTKNGVLQSTNQADGNQMAAVMETVVEREFPGFKNIINYFAPVLIANSNDMESNGVRYMTPEERVSAKGKRAIIWGVGGSACAAYGLVFAAGGPVGWAIAIVSCGVVTGMASWGSDSVPADASSSTDSGPTSAPGPGAPGGSKLPETQPATKPPQP